MENTLNLGVVKMTVLNLSFPFPPHTPSILLQIPGSPCCQSHVSPLKLVDVSTNYIMLLKNQMFAVYNLNSSLWYLKPSMIPYLPLQNHGSSRLPTPSQPNLMLLAQPYVVVTPLHAVSHHGVHFVPST